MNDDIGGLIASIEANLRQLQRPTLAMLNPASHRTPFDRCSRAAVSTRRASCWTSGSGTGPEDRPTPHSVTFGSSPASTCCPSVTLRRTSMPPEPRWQPGWLPILADGGGDFMAVDCSDGNHHGAVYHFRIDQPEHPLEYQTVRRRWRRIRRHSNMASSTLITTDSSTGTTVHSPSSPPTSTRRSHGGGTTRDIAERHRRRSTYARSGNAAVSTLGSPTATFAPPDPGRGAEGHAIPRALDPRRADREVGRTPTKCGRDRLACRVGSSFARRRCETPQMFDRPTYRAERRTGACA